MPKTDLLATAGSGQFGRISNPLYIRSFFLSLTNISENSDGSQAAEYVFHKGLKDSIVPRHRCSEIDVTDDGLAAVVKLSNGDMRKALNILQSTHMATPHVTEEAVYLCTGNPLPKDIEQIAHWLLNESFTSGFRYMKTRKGLALVDIVREVTLFIFRIKMPANTRVQLINDLADIEYRLSFGCNEKLHLGSLVSAFTNTRCSLVAAAK